MSETPCEVCFCLPSQHSLPVIDKACRAFGGPGSSINEAKPTPYGPDSAPGHRGAAKRDFPPNDGPSTTEAGRNN